MPKSADGRNLSSTRVVIRTSPLPKLVEKATAFGYFNAEPDPDGPFRRLRLLHKHGDKMYPALSLAAVAKYPDEVVALQEAGVDSAFNLYAEAGAGFAEDVAAVLAVEKAG